jgi:SAM-dependent methyltransferase
VTAFYEAGYSLPDRAEAERLGRWRALGARSKGAHVAALCARAGVRPRSLVEIGCGDGSLLGELSARGVAPALDGFELSAPAAEIARARDIPGAGRIEAYDGARVPAADGAYDLAVLSHVLEHVREPPRLLAEAARVGTWVLVEVPLEANRSAARPARRDCRRGHRTQVPRR